MDIENLTKDEFRDLWRDDSLEEIEDKIDDGWRHGSNHSTVFEVLQYPDDDGDPVYTGVYYLASYQIRGDKEYHGIYDKSFDLSRVYRHTRVVEQVYFSTRETE